MMEVSNTSVKAFVPRLTVGYTTPKTRWNILSIFMKGKTHLACTLILLMSACSGNSLAPKNSNEISVNSEPSGASVYVMGKLVGTTPTVINVNTVYPVTYSQENEQNYGRIKLTHENCSDRTITLNTRMISDGLKVKLDCTESEGQTAGEPSLADKSVNQRLKELQVLKDDGLINEKEYREIRTRILESL